MTSISETKARPPALKIDVHPELEPISTPLMRENFETNRRSALAISEEQLRAMNAMERNERVFQYLTPEEIWNVNETLLLRGRSSGSALPPLSVSGIVLDEQKERGDDERQAFDQHRNSRRLILGLSTDQLAQLPLAQIESFFPFLTADEIFSINDRLRQFKPTNAIVGGNNAMDSKHFLRCIHPSFSVYLDGSNGLQIKEEKGQNGLEIHDIIMKASQEVLSRLSEEEMTRLRPFLSTFEISHLRSDH